MTRRPPAAFVGNEAFPTSGFGRRPVSFWKTSKPVTWSAVAPVPESVRCPVCRQPTPWRGNPWRPFCSERCKLRDLGNWAAERYRIAGEKRPSEEDAKDNDGEGEE
jgi:uncharacterized protein